MAPGYNFSIPSFRHLNLPFSFLMIYLLLLLNLPFLLQAISFNRTDFRDWSKIKLDGYAGVINGLLTLADAVKNSTNTIGTVGRATFDEELRLWDSSTGKYADFDTSFTFSMKSNGRPSGPFPNMGDGFAFFLTNNGSHIPPHSEGACLGLISNCENTTLEKGLVAVEFDSFLNDWEKGSPSHIGINVNSIVSVSVQKLSVNWKDGVRGIARIWYNSLTKTLSVTLIYLNETYSLSHLIDLSEVLAERVTFGFSASTGELTSRNDIHSWQFRSTNFPEVQLNDSTEEDQEGSSGLMDLLLVVLASVLAMFFIVSDIALLVYFCYWKRTRRSKEEKCRAFDVSMDRELANDTGPKSFTYNELVRASNNFAEVGKLGEGGFGEVYKGYLRDLNLTVAIKKVSKRSKQGRKEYISEVKIISRLRHRNLVQLIGWCHENGELLLVYEFLPNGSLDSHLFNAKTKLSWAVRYKIVLGLASALLYLHEKAEQCVLHRDIKCNNIMLDSNFNAKLGDFGLARVVDEEAGFRTTGLAGTRGYMAPEYISTSKASKASDVFSFGVVALEIACGRKSITYTSEEDWVLLVSWVWESFGNEKLLDVVDERLCMEFDVKQMESLLIVGLWCVHPDHNLRPSIKEVIDVLSFKASLPDIPKRMPVAKYDIPVDSIFPSPTSEPLVTYSSLFAGRT